MFEFISFLARRVAWGEFSPARKAGFFANQLSFP